MNCKINSIQVTLCTAEPMNIFMSQKQAASFVPPLPPLRLSYHRNCHVYFPSSKFKKKMGFNFCFLLL